MNRAVPAGTALPSYNRWRQHFCLPYAAFSDMVLPAYTIFSNTSVAWILSPPMKPLLPPFAVVIV